MRTLPTQMIRVLLPFAPLFSKRIWQHAQLLLIGALVIEFVFESSPTTHPPRSGSASRRAGTIFTS